MAKKQVKAKKIKPKKPVKKGVGKIKTAEAIATCTDAKCPFHGGLKTRGRNFRGTITKKTHRTVKVEWPRYRYYPKYERFAKLKSAVHAHLPECLSSFVVGDYVKIAECRPLSKTKHFVVVEKVKSEIGSGGGEK